MRGLSIAVALMLLAAGAAFGQPAAPDLLWTHNFGGSGEDYAGWMENTPDNGFILAGVNGTGTHGGSDAWLIKTNGEGVEQWSAMYGGTNYDDFRGVDVLPDGSFIALGTTVTGYDENFYLVKTDGSGNLEWSHTYGGTSSDRGMFVRRCPDGGFILAGTTYSFGAGGPDAYLVKTDSLGAVQWTHTYGGPGAEDASSVRCMGDGYVFTGTTDSFGAGATDIWIVRVNSAGDVVWSHTFGGEDRDYPGGLRVTHDGGVIFAGVTFSFTAGWGDGYAVRLAPDGTTLWTRSYGTSAPESWREPIEMPDGGFFFIGLQNYAPYNFWVMRTDPQGNPIWSRNFGGPEMEWALSGQLTRDGGFAMCGQTYSYGQNGDAYLVRLAPDQVIPEHHFAPVLPTGLPYAVIVDSATLDNAVLSEGDEIAVFDGALCVGAGTLGHWPFSITAWQGDPEHDLSGFAAGHPMTFRVWQQETHIDAPAAATFRVGDGSFGSGVYSEVFLTATGALRQVIPLRAHAARLISLNVWPTEPTAQHVFGALGSLVAAYQDNGNVFIPPRVNTMGNLMSTAAYRLVLNTPDSIVVTGTPVNAQQDYHLLAGPWNWISYPFPVAGETETLLASLGGHLVIVQDDEGHAWIPSQDINTLTRMVPGKGYMLIVNENLTFHYSQGASVTSMPQEDPDPAQPLSGVTPTGLPYQVVLHLGDAVRRAHPQTVSLYDDNVLVGAATVTVDGGTLMVTAWQGLPEYDLQGFTPGHAMTVVVKTASGEQVPIQVSGSNLSFGSGAYAELNVDTDGASIAREFIVGEGYPNPFNPSVSIPFTIQNAGRVEARIINTLGQTVYQVATEYPAGEQHFVFDCNRLPASPVSGLYFVELRFSGQSQIRKVLLVK
ncbi:MAG TPA: T9SS type A sorting domain-containing protein [bacterium]